MTLKETGGKKRGGGKKEKKKEKKRERKKTKNFHATSLFQPLNFLARTGLEELMPHHTIL
jgi:hypothetical protein